MTLQAQTDLNLHEAIDMPHPKGKPHFLRVAEHTNPIFFKSVAKAIKWRKQWRELNGLNPETGRYLYGFEGLTLAEFVKTAKIQTPQWFAEAMGVDLEMAHPNGYISFADHSYIAILSNDGDGTFELDLGRGGHPNHDLTELARQLYNWYLHECCHIGKVLDICAASETIETCGILQDIVGQDAGDFASVFFSGFDVLHNGKIENAWADTPKDQRRDLLNEYLEGECMNAPCNELRFKASSLKFGEIVQ